MPVKQIDPETWRQVTEEKQKEMDALYRMRAEEIKRLYDLNWSKAHIARHFGITRERVGQILEGMK